MGWGKKKQTEEEKKKIEEMKIEAAKPHADIQEVPIGEQTSEPITPLRDYVANMTDLDYRTHMMALQEETVTRLRMLTTKEE